MPKLNDVEPPRDERPFGEVAFNYAAHDGRFIIGQAPWSFELKWSQAGSGSAHLLNDPVGITGVAIAEGVRAIAQITGEVVGSSDFTSRVRTPRVGQLALLVNTDGYYAALEPLEVGYSAAPSGNIMRLRFAIQTNGSADFSSFASAFGDRQALADQLLAAALDADQAIRAVPTAENIVRGNLVGIGHNQPPPEFAITEAERIETLASIGAIQQEAVSPAPAIVRLRQAGQTIARVAGKVASWIGRKADAAADEFAKTVGKAAAVAVVAGLAAWLALQSKLTVLADILSRFVG